MKRCIKTSESTNTSEIIVYHCDDQGMFNGVWQEGMSPDLGLHCSLAIRQVPCYQLVLHPKYTVTVPDTTSWYNSKTFHDITELTCGWSLKESTQKYRELLRDCNMTPVSKSTLLRQFLVNDCKLSGVYYRDEHDGYNDNCMCILDKNIISSIQRIQIVK